MAKKSCKKTTRIKAYLRCVKSDKAKASGRLMRMAEAAARKQKAEADRATIAAKSVEAQAKKAANIARDNQATKREKARAEDLKRVAAQSKKDAKAEAKEALRAKEEAKKASRRAEIDRRIAAKKPDSKYASGALGGIIGDRTTILTTSAKCLHHEPGEYRLVEVSRLIPSHDGQTFRKNPKYPAGVQERRYDRDKAEQAKVIGNSTAGCFEPAIVANTDPTPLGGPPVVAPTGIVLGGNSRAMVLQRVWSAPDGPAAVEYRAYIKRHAADFGLHATDVGSMSAPVIVRVSLEARRAGQADAVRRYNEGLTQALDATAEQVATSARIDKAIVDQLGQMGADESLDAFFKSSRSRHMVDLLVSRGVITKQRQNALIDKGGLLNPDGRQFVSRALVGKILPDADALDLLFNALPSLRENLARSVPYILSASGINGWDVTPALPDAARIFSAARASGAKTIDDYLKQQSLFSSGTPATTTTALLADIFLTKNGPLRLKNGFQKFANAARQTRTFDLLRAPLEPVPALAAAFGLAVPSGPAVAEVVSFNAKAKAAPKAKTKTAPKAKAKTAPKAKPELKPKAKPEPKGRRFYADVSSRGEKRRFVSDITEEFYRWVVLSRQQLKSPIGEWSTLGWAINRNDAEQIAQESASAGFVLVKKAEKASRTIIKRWRDSQ